MKKFSILKTLFCGILFTSFTGCTDMLNEEVSTFYNSEQVYSSKEGIESALNGMYSNLSGFNYYGGAWHGLVVPHSARFFSSEIASIDATSLNCTPENVTLPNLWGQMYSTINVANDIIYNIENNGIVLDNEDFALGQAHLVRGIVYFDLLRLFGAVPVRTAPAKLQDVHLAKSSKSEVYQQIIADLELAKQKLPVAGKYLVERPLKWAAHGYLAKVYMTMAAEDGGDPSKWQLAYNEAIQVFGKYSLVPNYVDLFVPGKENTSEAIFELQYGANGANRTSDMIRLYTPQASNLAPATSATFGRIRPNKEVFDQHRIQYPADPRIAATFIFDNYTRNTGLLQNVYPKQLIGGQSFPFIKKFLDPSYNGTVTMRNFILFRYADILLMLAEIENELNGPNNAYKYVNAVLTRARASALPVTVQPANWAGMNQAQFRTRIMKERQYELLCEGQDWFDTRRRGYEYFKNEVLLIHNNHAPNKASGVDFIYPLDQRSMLLPIPSTELAGNLKLTPADQNPGY